MKSLMQQHTIQEMRRENKIKTRLQQEQQKPNKSTRKYDKVSKKIRKLLGAITQTFIQDLCTALREDWYPYLTEEQVHNDKKLRDSIRDKIFGDWSYDSVYKRSEDNIWSDGTINVFLPKWLKNPIQQSTNTENLKRAKEEKIIKKIMISEREKQKIDQIAEALPDSVIVPEPETQGEQVLTDEIMHSLGVAPYGETGKSTRALTGLISEHAYKLFAALTNNTSPPDTSDDLIVDYIKPSREFRRGLMLEVDEHRRIAIHNALHYASVAIEDMIEIIDEIDKKQ